MRTVVHRHQHQPSGPLRGNMRDRNKFTFQGQFTSGEKLLSSLGNLSFDAMSIQHHMKWSLAAGGFRGFAATGSTCDGPTLQHRFRVRAARLNTNYYDKTMRNVITAVSMCVVVIHVNVYFFSHHLPVRYCC